MLPDITASVAELTFCLAGLLLAVLPSGIPWFPFNQEPSWLFSGALVCARLLPKDFQAAKALFISAFHNPLWRKYYLELFEGHSGRTGVFTFDKSSGQTTGREHSPTHQHKVQLKTYWARPHLSEQDPDSSTASPSHQEAFTSLLTLSIRGQREWKPQLQKTNQTDHPDHSLV